MTELKNRISFTVACVNEFARKNSLTPKNSFEYLLEHKGIEFLKENYQAEHTLSFDNIIEDLTVLCKNNGGSL